MWTDVRRMVKGSFGTPTMPSVRGRKCKFIPQLCRKDCLSSPHTHTWSSLPLGPLSSLGYSSSNEGRRFWSLSAQVQILHSSHVTSYKQPNFTLFSVKKKRGGALKLWALDKSYIKLLSIVPGALLLFIFLRRKFILLIILLQEN
jgi:hypothetical protein